jgi:Flp pilus assembly protein TadB
VPRLQKGDPKRGRKACGQQPMMWRMDRLPLNIVGLGLIIAGLLFAYFLSFVGIIMGLIMVIGGIVALWMTYRRKKYGTA